MSLNESTTRPNLGESIERLRERADLVQRQRERDRAAAEDSEWTRLVQALRLKANEIFRHHDIGRVPMTQVIADAGYLSFSHQDVQALGNTFPDRDWGLKMYSVAVHMQPEEFGVTAHLVYMFANLLEAPNSIRFYAIKRGNAASRPILETADEVSVTHATIVDDIASDMELQADGLAALYIQQVDQLQLPHEQS